MLSRRSDAPMRVRSTPNSADIGSQGSRSSTHELLGRAAPMILDGVRDQRDELWIKYGRPERAVWVPLKEFAAKAGAFGQLININPGLLEPKAQAALRSLVAKYDAYRPAITAASPGWHGRAFVLGTGEVLYPTSEAEEIIVTFMPNPKFLSCGTLESWQGAIQPTVAAQPLPLFALSLAFVGPLLLYAPPDYLSPLVEVAGDQGTGKSSLGIAAASVWAGNPESKHGGGETWDLSPGRFDELKFGHRHLLLMLDEANLAGGDQRQRERLTRQAIFTLTSSGVRQRFGDSYTAIHSQLAVLSTSNVRLSELAEGTAAERGAMAERLVTIPISKSRPHGIIDFVPAGYKSSAEAMDSLKAAASAHWGTAGPAFLREVQKRISRDEDRFRAQLAAMLARQVELLSEVSDAPRVRKIFALTAVAGQLARRWGILPEPWGSPPRAVRKVAREALRGVSPIPSASARIRAYAEQHKALFREVAGMKKPLDRTAFDACPGFLRHVEDRTELFVSAVRFRRAFSDFRQIVSALRRDGLARTEPGTQSKLTIKTPRAICREGRAYCFVLPKIDT